MGILNIILLVIICYCIFFVLSGYKENFELIPDKFKSKLKYTELKWNEKDRKKRL